jgi:hypothetical protein
MAINYRIHFIGGDNGVKILFSFFYPYLFLEEFTGEMSIVSRNCFKIFQQTKIKKEAGGW